MTTVRVGLFHDGAVTLLAIEHDKLAIKDLAPEAAGELIEMLKSFGTVLPEGTEDGYTAFIDFDRKRFSVRVDCPIPQLGTALPAEWIRYEANVVNPDPKKNKLGIYRLGDPAPKVEEDAEPAKPITGEGGDYVLKVLEQQRKKKH